MDAFILEKQKFRGYYWRKNKKKAITEIKNRTQKWLNRFRDDWNNKFTTVFAWGGGPVDLVSEKEISVDLVVFKQKIPVDLVFELCLRLPIHKLFQFMCVTNLWRSIISRPDLSKAYYSRNHSRVLVVSLIKLDDRVSYEPPQFYHSLDCEQWVRSPLKIPYSQRYPEFTQVINGLVCAYPSRGRSLSFLCNIFTGKVMKLPKSGDSDVLPFAFTRCYFAFDPVNSLYKLLRLVSCGAKIVSCKILTLGQGYNSSWRKLAVPENVTLTYYRSCRSSIVIHGVLYFCTLWGINAFNFTEEKFHLVPLPDHGVLRNYDLAQFREQLALLSQLNFRVMIIYMLNDNESYSWTRRQTILPWFTSIVRPVGSLATGEILLAPSNVPMASLATESRDLLEMLYSYDYEKDKFEKFVVGKLTQPINFRSSGVIISCLEQNVGSLDALIHGDGCFRYV